MPSWWPWMSKRAHRDTVREIHAQHQARKAKLGTPEQLTEVIRNLDVEIGRAQKIIKRLRRQKGV